MHELEKPLIDKNGVEYRVFEVIAADWNSGTVISDQDLDHFGRDRDEGKSLRALLAETEENDLGHIARDTRDQLVAVTLFHVDENNAANFSWAIVHPSLHRRHIASKIASTSMEKLIEDMEYGKIKATVANSDARGMIERLGFTFDRYKEECWLYKYEF